MADVETGPRETEEYWAAAAQGRLRIKRCRSCNEPHFYPRNFCPHCSSRDTEWQDASGTGQIYAFSVMRRAAVPYAIAYVTLDEGVSMLTSLEGFDLDKITIGTRVVVAFREKDGRWLPVFRPAQNIF